MKRRAPPVTSGCVRSGIVTSIRSQTPRATARKRLIPPPPDRRWQISVRRYGLASGLPSEPAALILQSKAELHGNLPVDNPTAFDVSACVQHFKPPEVPYRCGRLPDGLLHGVFHAFVRGSHQLDSLVHVV